MADSSRLPNEQPMEIEADSSLVINSADFDAASKPSDASENKVLMKFSLTMSKPSAARPPLFPVTSKRVEDEVEYVTEFDGLGRNVKEGPAKVIPMLENTWRPEKRMKNIMIETDLMSTTEDRFETDTVFSGPQPNVQYGLVKRKLSSSATDVLAAINGGTGGSPTANGNGHQLSAQEREIQKLREDVEDLPEETSMEAYENVSVEEFGEALLRGMGWEKGKPIGRNCTEVVAPIVHVRKIGRGGLGAIPAPQPEKEQKIRKPGEPKERKLKIGKIMCIISGKYIGLRGQVADMKNESYLVALLDGGKRVVCSKDELAEVGSAEEEKAMMKLHIKRDENGADKRAGSDRSGNKDKTREDSAWRSSEIGGASSEGIKNSQRNKEKYEDDKVERRDKYRNIEKDLTSRNIDDDKHNRDTRRKHETEYHEKQKSYEYEKSQRKLEKKKGEDNTRASQSWLAQDIRVKIIDKIAYGRNWYLQKGCIVDVVSPFVCDIQMDDGGKILQKVKQEHLETALPKQGGRVLVVQGRYRGQTGRLQERLSEKGVGIVQMDETYEIITSELDNLAEFVGLHHEIEG